MSELRTIEEDLKFFAARGFGKRVGFGNRSALIVIDIVNAFTDDSMPLGANLDKEIEQTNRLIDEAHAQNLPVIYSTVAYDEDDFKDAGIWALKQDGLSTLKAGTPAVEPDSRLHREPSDLIISKKYASCFYGTDLVSRLNARHVDTLILTGCTTSGCVRSTAVDALQNGYRPIVARDAVGDRSAAAHQQSLFDLDQKYADVMNVEEILAVLRTHAQK